MNKSNTKIDELDKKIIYELQQDARKPFLELSKKFKVSSGTIHIRVERLKKLGIISGSKITISSKALGYDVCCFIGIKLKAAKDYPLVLKNLKMFDEVVEAYYTTGNYNLFIKVMTQNIYKLHLFLTTKLQTLSEIQSTETILSLDMPIDRELFI